MVVVAPEPVHITDRLSQDLMFKFLCSGRVAFSDFLERWFDNDPERLAAFMCDLDEAGLRVVRSTG